MEEDVKLKPVSQTRSDGNPSLAQAPPINFKGSDAQLDMVRSRLMAIDESEISQFNLNVPSTISYAMKLHKAFDSDRSLFESTFTAHGFNPANYDDLPLLVGALWHADIKLNQLRTTSRELPELIETCKALYKKLDMAAMYLWNNHEKLSPLVESIRSGKGYLHLVDALARYGMLFSENWDAANGYCNITEADIHQAKDLSARLIVLLADADNDKLSEYRSLRDRAGEVLRRAVSDIRAAAAFVYRNTPDEMDRYPSLFSGRNNRRRKPMTSVEKAQSSDSNTSPPSETTASSTEEPSMSVPAASA